MTLTEKERAIVTRIFPTLSTMLDGLRESTNEVNALALAQVTHAMLKHSRDLMRAESQKAGNGKNGKTRLYHHLCLARGFENSALRTYDEIVEGRIKE